MKIKKTDRIVKEGDPIFEKLKSLETHGGQIADCRLLSADRLLSAEC